MNRIILCALLAARLFAVPLTAQTQEQQSDIEVFVTASRVEEPTEDIPAYVSVITAEQLIDSGQTTLVEALDGLAGIHFRSTSGNAAQAEISMRGFGENSHGRVLVLVDGRRLNRPDLASVNWLEIPVEDIERVEVVRGGSSILYGDNAVAGVVNIITKKGAAGFDVAVSGQYGSFNQNQEGLEVSGSGDLLSFSITGEHTSTDGYRDRSAFRSLAVGGNVGLELEQLSSELSLSYNRLFYEMPGALTKAEFEADPTQAQPGHDADESTGDYLDADLSFSFSPSESTVLSTIAGYRFRFIRTDIPPFISFTDLSLQSAALTPKLKLEQSFLNGNRLVVGIDGYFDQADLDSYPDINRTSTTLETRIRKATLGAYVADDLQILPVLTASAGLRYELARISAKTLKTSGTPVDDDKLHQALVYDIGVQFNPAPCVKLWSGYGTVFRYPFVDEQVSMYGFGSDTFYSDLDPERGYNIEAGVEVVLGPWLQWVASGYLVDMKDEIAVVETAPFVYENVNQDKTRHLGAETEILVSIPSWAELSANYALALATFRAGADRGNTIPLIPAHQAGAGITIHLPLAVTAGLSGQYVSQQYTGGDTANVLEMIDAYFLMDAFVRFQPEYVHGDLDLYFGINNLLDVTYATTGYSGTYYPGEGRSWKLGASYRY